MIIFFRCAKIRSTHVYLYIKRVILSEHQAPVVQKVDNVTHRLNHYPLDSAIGFPNTYPFDSDLSPGKRYPTFEQLGPEEYHYTLLRQQILFYHSSEKLFPEILTSACV